MQSISVKNNELIIGGISARELVAEFGSPLYVYDESIIIEKYQKLYNSINYDKKRIHYAMKANSNLRFLQVLEKEGSFIDAVSKEEALIALKAGFSPDRVLFTTANLTLEEMRFAVENKIIINIGSLYNLQIYAENFKGTSMSIRINPDFGAGHHSHVVTGGRNSKFGIFYDEINPIDLIETKKIIKDFNLKLTGVHAHIGSGILEVEKYVELMEIILKLAGGFPGLEFIDVGGGIGVPYRPEEKDFDLVKLGIFIGDMMSSFTKKYGSRPYLALEPGKFLSAESGFLLTTVTDIKNNPKFSFAGVDSGFNHLIRPMAYGSYHHIINASRIEDVKKNVVIAGYLCESGDTFTRSEEGIEAREISNPQPGDILAILNAGAYGYSMSSNYNSRPRPAEVMVREGTARLVRRRENFEDLTATQI